MEEGGSIEIAPRRLVVEEVVRETDDCTTLLFGGGPYAYAAGQFLTIDAHQFRELAEVLRYFETVKGRPEPPRAYSMSSTPREAHLAVTIKAETWDPGRLPYPPLLSPLLVHGIAPGRTIDAVGFTGPYTLPERFDPDIDHLVHVCAGSGIVPNFSLLKNALERRLPLRQTLLYGNRTRRSIIFREPLDRLARDHPGELRVVHALTREPGEPYGWRSGRIGRALLEEAIGDRRHAIVFVCGPGVTTHERRAARRSGVAPAPRFLETVLAHLRDLKVEKNRIRYEVYG